MTALSVYLFLSLSLSPSLPPSLPPSLTLSLSVSLSLSLSLSDSLFCRVAEAGEFDVIIATDVLYNAGDALSDSLTR